MIKRLGHVGIVVTDLDDALKFCRNVFGLDQITVKALKGKARVAFVPIGDGEIEFIQPLNPNSFLGDFIAKHGVGIHHIALVTDDIEAEMENMKEKGVEFVTEKPYMGAHGVKIAFPKAQSTRGFHVELCEERT
jgi:methylmalonyl-CoA/ethylmalonyl-CoA epimerase